MTKNEPKTFFLKMINFNIIFEIYFLHIYLFNFKFNNNYEF